MVYRDGGLLDEYSYYFLVMNLVMKIGEMKEKYQPLNRALRDYLWIQ